MTYKELVKKINPKAILDNGTCCGCPSDYGLEDQSYTVNCTSDGGKGCTYCWNREVPGETVAKVEAFIKAFETSEERCAEILSEPRILDSGHRRQFETGAVRDICEGKGRCDLLPLDVVAWYYEYIRKDCMESRVFMNIHHFQQSGNYRYLYEVLDYDNIFPDHHTEILEVAKHFEEGCKKYGDNNWQKGIPTHCYIDSAVRHYLKYLRGDEDEPHDRAFCWNILCCIWTCIHKPELNDYAMKKEEMDG